MQWTETITYEFVKIYGKYDCLWNPSDPHYKNRLERDKAYNLMIEDFFNKTQNLLCVLEIKRKIKNLRTTYMQQVNKILEKSTPNGTYKPTLFWFNAMDNFLKNVPIQRHLESASTANDRSITIEVPSSTEIWTDQNENTSLEEQDNQVFIEESTSNALEQNPDPLTTNSDDDKYQAKIKDKVYFPTKLIKKKKFKFKNPSRFSKKKQDSDLEDEFDIYGRYIATQLRSMALPKAIRVQLAIQNIVGKARLSKNSL